MDKTHTKKDKQTKASCVETVYRYVLPIKVFSFRFHFVDASVKALGMFYTCVEILILKLLRTFLIYPSVSVKGSNIPRSVR